MNVLIGYIFLLIYCLVVFILIGNLAKKMLGVAFSRKLIHVLTGMVWFIYDYFIGNSFHQIIICTFFLLIAILSRIFNIIKTIETGNKSNGTIYYSIALLFIMILSYFIPALYPYVGFSIMVLAIGDGSATLVGKYIRSIKIYHDKTLFGFLGCILFTFIALILYNYFYCNYFKLYELALIAIVAGIFEEEDLNGFDNVSVSLSTFATMIILNNYPDTVIAFYIFCVLFLICFFAKIMTYHGSLLSAFIGTSYFYIAGWKIALYISILYLLLIAIHIIRKIIKVRNLEIVKKDKGKDLMQVVANGIISLSFLYLYLFIDNQMLLLISLIVFSNSFIDSIASDIGSMSKKEPYDIIKKEKVKQGTSGGISLLGTLSAFFGSIVFSIAIYYLIPCNIKVVIISVFSMMICCFTDSIFGSLLQVKYKCNKCGLITEKEYHCGEKLEIYSGYKFINNDTVNLLCSCLCGILCLIILVIE